MANSKEYVIQLSVDGQGAINNIDKVNESIQGTTEVTKSAKAQLRELNAQLATLEQGSEEFNRVSLAAGQLRDQINDAAEAIRANAGNSVEVLSNNVGNLENQFVSLDFEGITQSFNGIGNAISNFKFDTLKNGLTAIGQGFKTLGTALLANPLFLIAGIIIAVGAAMVALQDKIKPIGKLFDAVGDAIGYVIDKIDGFLMMLGLTASEAERANQKVIDSSEELLNSVDKRYNREIKLAQAAGKETFEIEVEKRKEQLKTIDTVIKALEEKSRIEGELNEDDLKKLKELNEQKLDTETDLQAIVIAEERKKNEKLKEEEERAAAQRKADAARRSEERKREAEKRAEEAKRAVEKAAEAERQALLKANQDRIAQEDAQFALRQELLLTDQQKEIAARVKTFEEQQIAAGNDAELQKLIREKLQADLAAINQKYADAAKAKTDADVATALEKEQAFQDLKLQLLEDGLAKQEALEIAAAEKKYADLLAANQGNAEAIKIIEEAKRKELEAIGVKYDNAELENKRKLEEAKIKLAGDAFGAIGNLISSFQAKDEASAKKQFAITKAFNLAAALTNTYLAVTGALTAGGNPIKLATGTQFIEAGIAAATGLANVAKIASTKFGSTGSGGGGTTPSATGGTSGGMSSPAPVFNPINLDFLNNRPQQAIPAYVLSGAVTNAQVADQQIQDKSRL